MQTKSMSTPPPYRETTQAFYNPAIIKIVEALLDPTGHTPTRCRTSGDQVDDGRGLMADGVRIAKRDHGSYSGELLQDSEGNKRGNRRWHFLGNIFARPRLAEAGPSAEGIGYHNQVVERQ